MVSLSDYQAGQIVVVAYSPGGETVAQEQVKQAEQVGASVKHLALSEVASAGLKDVNKVRTKM